MVTTLHLGMPARYAQGVIAKVGGAPPWAPFMARTVAKEETLDFVWKTDDFLSDVMAPTNDDITAVWNRIEKDRLETQRNAHWNTGTVSYCPGVTIPAPTM